MAQLHTSLASLHKAQVVRFHQMRLNAKQTIEYRGREGFKDELSATSGRLTTAMLRAMGHPYGRLMGPGSTGRGLMNAKSPSRFIGAGKYRKQITRKGSVQPLPINKQKGVLRRGLTLKSQRGGMAFDLFVNERSRNYVLLPEGTKRMIGRGLLGPSGLLIKRDKARLAAYVEYLRQKNARTP